MKEEHVARLITVLALLVIVWVRLQGIYFLDIIDAYLNSKGLGI